MNFRYEIWEKLLNPFRRARYYLWGYREIERREKMMRHYGVADVPYVPWRSNYQRKEDMRQLKAMFKKHRKISTSNKRVRSSKKSGKLPNTKIV